MTITTTTQRALHQAHIERQNKFFPPAPRRIIPPKVERHKWEPREPFNANLLQRRADEITKALNTFQPAPLVFGFNTRMPTIQEVIKFVAIQTHVHVYEFLAPSRRKQISGKRHIAMHLAARVCGKSLPAIGRVMKRDHTTVLHGDRNITFRRDRDPAFDRLLTDWECFLRSGWH